MREWIRKALKKHNRNVVPIHFHPHADIRIPTRNADIDKVVETARRGRVHEKKSTYPDRIAFSHFFKDGYSYIVIVKLFPNSFQVMTVWTKRGRI